LCYVLPADSGQLPDCVIRAAGQDEVTSPSNICSGNAFKPTWHGMDMRFGDGFHGNGSKSSPRGRSVD